jgi:aldose 1-epimerase
MAAKSLGRTRRQRVGDLEATVLSWGPLEAWIVPSHGSNLARLTVEGKAVIDFDPVLLARHDYTGTPVLYPTPNRVRGGVFRWKGRDYRQLKGGQLIVEHGLAHDEAWQRGEPELEAGGVRLETWLDFQPGAAAFEAFPFPHRLGLEFRLSDGGLRVSYTIRNQGEAELPFGFGLHPYFQKLSGEEGTFVCLPADSIMEATSDLLPTGRLLPVGGTPYDLRRPAAVGTLDLDHVFTGIRPGEHARIEYRGLGLTVRLEASPDFSHLVLYTPRGEAFFCLENQTCSTDAHNLHDRGFAGESGLKTVPPGQVRQGSVTYSLSY